MRSSHAAALIAAFVLSLTTSAFADLRIKQKITMGAQTIESTRSIKGQRERTEQKIDMGDPGATDFMPQIATITQCDLRRTVKLNDAKRLYTVEPFARPEPAAAPAARRTEVPARTGPSRTGGTVTMSFYVRDTGERKMMFGMQARHLIITQEMESSADSCNGPSRTKIEFDGWYVDLSADFNCPIDRPEVSGIGGIERPDCVDRYVTKGNAAARLGFLLEGTMKMFGTDGSVQMTQTTETLELTRSPLSATLFEIPAGYTETASPQDLYAITMPNAIQGAEEAANRAGRPSEAERAPIAGISVKSVAVSISLGPVSGVSQQEIEQYVRGRIAQRGLRAVTGTGDYTVAIQFARVKESAAGKIGGIFGKVTGVPTGNVAKIEVELTGSLAGAASGQARVKSKFDGPLLAAVKAAVDEALDQLFEKIDN